MRKCKLLHILMVGLLAAPLALVGCSGDDGKDGAPGAPGTSTGTLSGTVTSAADASGLGDAAVTLDPAVAGVSATVNQDGTYSVASLPVGVYTVTFSADGYASSAASVSILAGQTTTEDAALEPTAPAAATVSSEVTGTLEPGQTPTVTLTAENATIDDVTWTVEEGAEGVSVAAAAAGGGAYDVTLPDVTAFKDRYFEVVASRVVKNSGQSALRDRDMVMGIIPLDLEEAGAVKLKAEVTLSDGSTVDHEVEIAVELPFKITTGIQNVPLGIPVLLHGKTDASWSMTAPASSAATLEDADTTNPYFTPDVAGMYALANATSGVTLNIYAGQWGVPGIGGAYAGIASTDANGNPDPEFCVNCHGNGSEVNQVAAEWAESGHAEILAQNVDTTGPSHYSKSCFTCHTVGYDPTVDNGGIDDQTNFVAFLDKYFPESNHGNPPTNANNFADMLQDYPTVTSFTNIQCENCHGPNGSSLHNNGTVMDSERVSISSDVCGSCHGEPTHHGRFQEWQESGHADYSLPEGHEGFSGDNLQANCIGCHTGEGALRWFGQLADGNPLRTLNATDLADLQAYLTPDNIHPITCVVCHDPHNPGDTSGSHGVGLVRISGDTSLLPAGFTAVGVGKGAMCITCHNSRNGGYTDGGGNPAAALHEDNNPEFGTLTGYSAPHEACQGDVLMGRNAYFVNGVRSAHSNIENTCVYCHMDAVPAPAEFGSAAQTNHTFEANLDICADCHGAGFDGEGVQTAVAAELEELKAAIEAAVTKIKGDGVAVTYASGRQPSVTPEGAADSVALGDYLDGVATDAQTDILAKANWNYSLIEQDASEGVHNPSFAHDVLFATVQQVDAL